MKICHVIPYFLPSQVFAGPITAVYEMAKALVNRGHEVEVFTTNALGQNNFPEKFEAREFIDGVKVTRFRVYGHFMSYYFTPHMLSLLRKDFDIIHAHGYRNFQGDAAALCAKIKRLPFVLNTHGMGIPAAAEERKNPLGGIIYRVYDLLTLKLTLRMADVVIATSTFEKAMLQVQSFLRDKIQIIPLGIDPSHFKKMDAEGEAFRRRYNITGEMLLYVGRIDKGKNIKMLLRCARSLMEDHPSMKVVIVGEGVPSTYIGAKLGKNDLIQYSRKIGLKNVLFVGALYGRDLLAAYSAADVFINPSISKAENFGLVNVEAAACSLPVVAAPVGVAPDLLDQHSWLLFKSEQDMSKAVKKLLQDRELRMSVGRALRKTVERDYAWEKIAEKLESQYKRLAG
jgi:glycosyltransferase involved in cell wall biosynthesis